MTELSRQLSTERVQATSLSRLLLQQIQKVALSHQNVAQPAGLHSGDKVLSSTKSSSVVNLPPLPPFYWLPSQDYTQEFDVSGRHRQMVTKMRDFEDQGWVIPVAGSLRMYAGSVYRWRLKILRKCSHRPQMQFGLHGMSHEKPWRLVTTSRCSRSKDDDPWKVPIDF